MRSWLPHGPSPVILMYHRVADEDFDPWGLAVAPAAFREQLEWLAKHRTILSLVEFAALHQRRSLPNDAVAVTFDDGYSCVREIAPLLQSLGVRATVFLPVDLIGTGKPFWWDELEEIVLTCEASTLSLDGKEVAIAPVTANDVRWLPRTEPNTPRKSGFQEILTRVTRKKPSERESIMDELRSQVRRPCEAPPYKQPLRPEEVREIAGGGVEFGSHTRAHPWLPDLSLEEQRQEIHGSVERLHALTGTRPTAFAYPYGVWDKRSLRLVEEAGFNCACTVGGRSVSTRSHHLALPRVRVGNWDAAGLEQALAGLLPA